MLKKLSMKVFVVWTILLSGVVATSPAHSAPGRCGVYLNPAQEPVQPLTPAALAERAQVKIDKINKIAPPPEFLDITKESKIRWPRVEAPRALQDLLGPDLGFESSPAPGAEHPMAVNLLKEGVSIPYHVDMKWKGQPTSTTVYASLPAPITPEDNGYVVGKKYKYVVFHLHGGGTPTATGKNAMSIGSFFAKLGVPVLGPDMPGHGRGPRVPMVSFQEQVDWVLALMDKIVDPSVQVILSGHSWGGEFAVFMNRHSNDPKYSRIKSFISLSPPVDMSLGKNDASKDQFEEWFQKNFHLFEKQIAEADYDFQKNMVENGKMSSVGSFYTNVSHIDYLTPPLTEEQQQSLKPLMVIVGQADGLVYVGREKVFQEIFGNLKSPSQFIILPPGYKFKTKNDKEKPLVLTGHNIFDRYRDGTEQPETYSLMAENFLGRADVNLLDGAPEVSPARQLVDEILRQWANFFQFRELVDSYVSYDLERHPSFEAVTKRKVELMDYLSQVEDLKKKLVAQQKNSGDKALAEFRGKLGIQDALTPERAQWELSRPALTPEREALLKDYIEKVRRIDEDMHENYKDTLASQDLAKLWNTHEKALGALGLTSIEEYKAKFDEYTQLKGKLTPVQEKTRSLLSQIHQKYTEIVRAKQGRFGSERDRRVALLTRPPQVDDPKLARRELELDRSAERRAALEKYVAGAGRVLKTVEEQNQKQVDAAVAAVKLPSGLTGLSQVDRAIADTDALLKFRFVPAGHREIEQLVNRINMLEEARHVKITAVEKELEQLQRQSNAAIAQWDALWEAQAVTSPKLEAVQKNFERELQAYTDVNMRKEDAVATYLRDLKARNALTEEAILKRPGHILKLEWEFAEARRKFMKVREARERLKWSEALAGVLKGQPEQVAQAQSIAQLLRGEGENLTARIQRLSAGVEDHYRKESVMHQEQDRLQWLYSQKMNEAGIELPQSLVRVVVKDLLRMSYKDLINDLERNPAHMHALSKLLRTWHEMIREIRTESQVKALDTY